MGHDERRFPLNLLTFSYGYGGRGRSRRKTEEEQGKVAYRETWTDGMPGVFCTSLGKCGVFLVKTCSGGNSPSGTWHPFFSCFPAWHLLELWPEQSEEGGIDAQIKVPIRRARKKGEGSEGAWGIWDMAELPPNGLSSRSRRGSRIKPPSSPSLLSETIAWDIEILQGKLFHASHPRSLTQCQQCALLKVTIYALSTSPQLVEDSSKSFLVSGCFRTLLPSLFLLVHGVTFLLI